ncbi:astacin-like metalloendopeptidase [Pangshura tecta]
MAQMGCSDADKPSVKIIKEAFADFARFTCIKFVPYSYQRDFISIMPMSGCFSSVGRTGGMQVVSLAPACLRRGKGVTLHELMHVVGFWHEHSRADRDKYISISWNEILTGFEINFMKSWNSNMLVNYDYASVMHYGRYAFSMTGLPTIIPLANPYVALGQRWNLSSSDIARVNKLYKCSPTLTGSESPTESSTQENIMDFLSNELEPCPTEGEIKVSTPSPTAGSSSPRTKPPETVQSAKRPSRQMTRAPTAWTEEIMDRTAMDVEGLNVSLVEHPIVESETFEPTRLPTHGITHLEATRKPPPPHMEMETHPSDLFAVNPELLHLVGKRSLPDQGESPALPHDSNPDLKVITLIRGHTEMQSHLLSKVLEVFQKKHIQLPDFQVSPITGLYPAAKEIKSVPWLETGATSAAAPDHKHGLFSPKDHLFSDRKKTTSLTPFLLSAEAVLATAAPAMDKPIAAPLPRRQSSSSKRTHHILPAQRATVQPAWQVCDFEKDLCSWQQSDTDDFDWILAGERPPARSAIGGNLSETHSPSRGGYISLKSPSARQTTGHKTSLISPILHRIGCIHFWYSPLGSVMGTINIYIKLADAPEWHRIWSAKGQQGRDWHQVGVETSESQKLQVMVEGVIGPDTGSDVGIDDLSVCVAECQGGCDELIHLYKK